MIRCQVCGRKGDKIESCCVDDDDCGTSTAAAQRFFGYLTKLILNRNYNSSKNDDFLIEEIDNLTVFNPK
uniref:Uncharacterized protein n=1 Tax=Romanomermis culicivorax TaxID=13658 RepID=A0A915HTI4_ROMCU